MYDFGVLTYLMEIKEPIQIVENVILRNPVSNYELEVAYSILRQAEVENNMFSSSVLYDDFDKRLNHHQKNMAIWETVLKRNPDIKEKETYFRELSKYLVLFEHSDMREIQNVVKYFNFINTIKTINLDYSYWSIEPIGLYREEPRKATFYFNKYSHFGRQLVHVDNGGYFKGGELIAVDGFNNSFELFVQRINKYMIFYTELNSSVSPGFDVTQVLSGAYDGHNLRVNIVDLTSVLEALLTNNPNSDLYHIENSINRQFRIKIITLLYMNDKDINLDLEEMLLEELYNYRSKHAHGNLNGFNKQSLKDKLKNYKGSNSERINQYIHSIDEYGVNNFFIGLAMEYLLIIVDMYLEHSEFMKKLKVMK